MPNKSAKRRTVSGAPAESESPSKSASATARPASAAKGSETVDIESLIRLARNKSTAARTQLAATINDLFLGKDDVLTDSERDLMNDILRHLIHEVEMSVRRDLADRLSRQPRAPRDLIMSLANDEIEVAHPILTRSEVLHNLDLIEIIHHRTLEHRLAIAMRENVDEEVSDALVETGQGDVIAVLLENPSAKISRTTMEYLVEQSKRIDRFHNPLVARPDLGPDLAKKMYWWVSAALRQHIVENFDVDPTELDNTIETAVTNALAEVESYDPAATKPFELAERLQEAQAITPQLLIQVLRQGEVNLFEALFVKLTGIRLNLARRVLFEQGGEGLAVACKAIGIGQREFGTIFTLSRRSRAGVRPAGSEEVAKALEFFDRVTPETAKAVLQRWRRNPNFLDSLRRLDAGPDDAGGPAPEQSG